MSPTPISPLTLSEQIDQIGWIALTIIVGFPLVFSALFWVRFDAPIWSYSL